MAASREQRSAGGQCGASRSSSSRNQRRQRAVRLRMRIRLQVFTTETRRCKRWRTGSLRPHGVMREWPWATVMRLPRGPSTAVCEESPGQHWWLPRHGGRAVDNEMRAVEAADCPSPSPSQSRPKRRDRLTVCRAAGCAEAVRDTSSPKTQLRTRFCIVLCREQPARCPETSLSPRRSDAHRRAAHTGALST